MLRRPLFCAVAVLVDLRSCTNREKGAILEHDTEKERRSYASDLSDSQWAVIAPLFPRAGNRSKWEKRELVNAVLYLIENGCKWRNLPHDFPPYTTVANFYYAAIRSGLWGRIRAALVERVRTDAGRNAGPSYAIIDSQSVKTTSAAEERGVDGGKKQKDANVTS